MDILSPQDHNAMLDELMNQNTSDVRRAKILSDLMTERETVHKSIQERDEKFTKLEEESGKLVDVNRKLMSEMFSGKPSISFGGKEEKTFSETVSIEKIEKANTQW